MATLVETTGTRNMQDAVDASTTPDPPPKLTSSDRPAQLPSSSQDSNSYQRTPTKSTNLATSDVSPTSHHTSQTDDYSPPTSAGSNHRNSQENDLRTQSDSQPNEVDGAGQQEVPRDKKHGSSLENCELGSVTGQKRTATGHIKRSSVNGITDTATKSNGYGHTRTSSVLSNGSVGNVTEVSQQLRTKLKYAMVKVQNGWQARTFDEIESLASQSPRSALSGFQSNFPDGSVLSPRTAISRKYQRRSSESDSSENTVAQDQHLVINTIANQQNAPRRSLAPPVDIMSGSRRRPTPNTSYQKGNGLQLHARHLHSSRPNGNQRTPSQNAAMEADAVETLLFMASPGNSGYNPPGRASQESLGRTSQLLSSQTSPLRSQFSQTSMSSPKKVAFSDQSSSDSYDKSAMIDRMLDDLSDDSDDGLLENAFRLAEKSKPNSATVST